MCHNDCLWNEWIQDNGCWLIKTGWDLGHLPTKSSHFQEKSLQARTAIGMYSRGGGRLQVPLHLAYFSLSAPLADRTGLLSVALLSSTLGRDKLIQESESTVEGFSVLVTCYKADFRNFLPHPSIPRALPQASVSKAWLSSSVSDVSNRKHLLETLISAEVCLNAVVSIALQAPFSCFLVTVGQIRSCIGCYPELFY